MAQMESKGDPVLGLAVPLWLNGLAPMLRDEGVDVDRLRRNAFAAHSDNVPLIARTGVVPVEIVNAMWDELESTQGNSAIGARLGVWLRPYRLGPLGDALVRAQTITQLVDAFTLVVEQMVPAMQMQSGERNGQFEITLVSRDPDRALHRQGVHALMGMIISMTRWLSDHPNALQMAFAGARPGFWEDLESVFGMEVVYSAECWRLWTPAELARRPFPLA